MPFLRVIAHPAVLWAIGLLVACGTSTEVPAQKWYEIPPDVTASLKYGVDGNQYALGGVTDYQSPAGSNANALVYVAREINSSEPIPSQTAGNVAAKFANVSLCANAGAKLVDSEPPVYRKDINAWSIALACAS